MASQTKIALSSDQGVKRGNEEVLEVEAKPEKEPSKDNKPQPVTQSRASEVQNTDPPITDLELHSNEPDTGSRGGHEDDDVEVIIGPLNKTKIGERFEEQAENRSKRLSKRSKNKNLKKHLDKIKPGRSDPSKQRLLPKGRQEKNIRASPPHRSLVRMKKKRKNLQPEDKKQMREKSKIERNQKRARQNYHRGR